MKIETSPGIDLIGPAGIDQNRIYEEILEKREDLTDNEKEFARQVTALREECVKEVQAEIDPIIKKYAKIQAEKTIELYNIYIKGERNDR